MVETVKKQRVTAKIGTTNIMAKPLPVLLDEISDGINSVGEAVVETRTAADLAAEAAKAAQLAADKAGEAAKEAVEAGLADVNKAIEATRADFDKKVKALSGDVENLGKKVSDLENELEAVKQEALDNTKMVAVAVEKALFAARNTFVEECTFLKKK